MEVSEKLGILVHGLGNFTEVVKFARVVES